MGKTIRKNLHVDDLRFLGAVAEHHTVKDAAKACRILQPRATRILSVAEKTLGATLCLRGSGNQKIILTEIGKRLSAASQRFYEEMDALKAMATYEKDSPSSQRITIQTSAFFAHALLRPIVEGFRKEHSEVIVNYALDGHPAEHIDMTVQFTPVFPPLKAVHCTFPFALFVSKAYLEAHGGTIIGSDLKHTIFLSHDIATKMQNKRCRIDIKNHCVVLENEISVLWSALEGCGIGILPRMHQASIDPHLVEIEDKTIGTSLMSVSVDIVMNQHSCALSHLFKDFFLENITKTLTVNKENALLL